MRISRILEPGKEGGGKYLGGQNMVGIWVEIVPNGNDEKILGASSEFEVFVWNASVLSLLEGLTLICAI